jgi:lactoylglutathione lyase
VGQLTSARWTHVAIPSGDLDKSIEFYTTYTPLVVLETRQDEFGRSAWLCHEGQVENPFILVLVMFFKDQGTPQAILAPFAHIGVEVPNRSDVDEIAHRGAEAGCLKWEPHDAPPPVGYVCALTDPDGNVLEISHNQGVYDSVQRKWGAMPAAV